MQTPCKSPESTGGRSYDDSKHEAGNDHDQGQRGPQSSLEETSEEAAEGEYLSEDRHHEYPDGTRGP